MRLTIVAILLVAVSWAVAQSVVTQKPDVAPSITAGDVAPETGKSPPLLVTGPNPAWIWGPDPNTPYSLKQTVELGDVKSAHLAVSCDNHCKILLNGKSVVDNDEWQSPSVADVTRALKAGKNTIEARVRNEGGPSGFLLKLVVVDRKGKTQTILSDDTWTATAAGKSFKVKKLTAYGGQPWGKVLDNLSGSSRIASGTFQVLPGFQVERLFTVPREKFGSWVCLVADPKGRLIASDQGGQGLYRITPPKPGTDEETKVEKLNVKISAAQGFLFAFDSFYVCCNGGPGSGLYRLRDTNGDDQFDEVKKLKAFQGGGEHGPHALRLSPDGKSIVVIAGNHTRPPQDFQKSRLPRNWDEDLLLPRQWDANGHARGILAPGGWVAKTDPEGKTWEILTAGYRNPYEMAYNADGELFVYDADMEWDMGMPWYRPTRVNHATSGSELGWRSGTGKWPEYYPDSLPAMVDIGPGSPVGVEFGYGAKFPAKYQKALYICDWTFGTMYAIHITPEGSSYKATKEEFVSRTPLPLTDVVINPVDGFMYFTVGGRGTQSELFRVRYVGKESTAPVDYKDPRFAELRAVRHKLEAYHQPVDNPEEAVNLALSHLAHSDRFIRYAARVALEHQPVKAWRTKVLAAKDADTVIQGVIALARQADKSLQPQLLAALEKLDFAKLDERQQLDLLRAYSLVFARMGKPDEKVLSLVAQRLDPFFPSSSDAVNRELCQVLVYCGSTSIVTKTVKLLQQPSKPLSQEGIEELLARNRGYGGSIANMLRNAPDLQKLALVFALRNAVVGWNLELRKAYFAAIEEARSKSGGASYQGFLRNIETDAYNNATDSDRLAIEAAGLRKPFKPKELPKAKGPGKKWTVADLLALEPKLKGRDFKNGQKMYAAARCVICHRFGGDGGATGPDLSQVAGRFSLKDLGEAIIEPSKVISDQYKASIVTTQQGKVITGRIVSEADGKLTIVADPEDSTKVQIVAKKDIESIATSPTSLMPGELLDTLNEAEVLDLLAYFLSRGDPSHPMFKRR